MPSSGCRTANNEATLRNCHLLAWRRLTTLSSSWDFYLTHPTILGSLGEHYCPKVWKVAFLNSFVSVSSQPPWNISLEKFSRTDAFLYVKIVSVVTLIVIRVGTEGEWAISFDRIRIWLCRKFGSFRSKTLEKHHWIFFSQCLLFEENNHPIWFNHEVWVLWDGMHISVHCGRHSVMAMVIQVNGTYVLQIPMHFNTHLFCKYSSFISEKLFFPFPLSQSVSCSKVQWECCFLWQVFPTPQSTLIPTWKCC